MFFNRICAAQQQQDVQVFTPKGKLIDIGDTPAPLDVPWDEVEHDGSGVFAGLPSPFTATRYHSLAVAPESLPDCLIVNATAADATVQGVRHRELPIHGVQFHPESIATEHGHAMLANFMTLAGLPVKTRA